MAILKPFAIRVRIGMRAGNTARNQTNERTNMTNTNKLPTSIDQIPASLRSLPLHVALLRMTDKDSRAVGTWTYYGSTGAVRKATCTACRRLLATCSNKWAETVGFRRAANGHECDKWARLRRAAKGLQRAAAANEVAQ